MVLNFLKCNGWLFNVDGKWKLYLIRFFLWFLLFLYIVLICDMVMCDLLIIINVLLGK